MREQVIEEFLPQLKAPPFSSQAFDLTSMWYELTGHLTDNMCEHVIEEFLAQLNAPPLPSQAFDLTSMWYCVDLWNAR